MSKRTVPIKSALRAVSNVKDNEIAATVIAFAIVFLLMATYYVLRPVRDAMASDWTDLEVSFLWNLNFFISAAAVALYGLAASRVRVRLLVPMVYIVFAASFAAFFLLLPTLADRTLADKAFYVWVSVFALFHVSVFWSLMADTFSQEQSRRLFAVIAAGASLGALLGPAVPTLFAGALGTDGLMLIAAAGMLLVLPLVFALHHLKVTALGNAEHRAGADPMRLGGAWWAGFKAFASNRYLLGIGAFILLFVFVSSFIYFEQKNLLAPYPREQRYAILGSIDWLVNALTFGLAFFVTGRLADRIGMPFTLALVPVFVVLGMLILAFAPIITVVLALQVARRAGNYAVTRPAREMLFTRVSREDRYKAKPVVDIVVYRGGDAVSGSVFAALTEGLGLGLTAMSLVGAGIAALWAGIAIRLGRRFDAGRERASDPVGAPTSPDTSA